MVIGRKKNAFAIRMEKRGPVGARQIGYLLGIRPVNICDEYVERFRFYKTILEKGFVRFCFFSNRPACSPNNLLAVAGEKGTSVVAQAVC